MQFADSASEAAVWLATADIRFVSGWVNPQVAWRCGRHQHPDHELVLHAKGRGTTGCDDGSELTFAPGDVVWYPPGLAHDQQQNEAGENWCLHLAISRPLPHPGACVIPLGDDAGLLADLRALARGAPHPGPLAQLRADRLAQAAVAGILEHHFSAAMQDQPGAQPARALHLHLSQHFADPGRLGDFAVRQGLSADHLRQCFQARYGITPLRWLTQVRLTRAQDLLQRSDLDLAAIAADCGFTTARYFCEVFHREIGCTPGAFRRQEPIRRQQE
jgi:AraC-like DNA-binding protein